MFKDNLIALRKRNHMTQEELAEKIGVSRQALAKWETGETVPDLERSALIAQVFSVTLDDLVNQPDMEFVLSSPSKKKHVFGHVKVGEKGQIVIPVNARRIFGIKPGDGLIVLGDEDQGLALLNEQHFWQMAEMIRKSRE